MDLYIFIIILSSLIIFFFLGKTSYIIYIKSFFFPIVCVVFILLLVVYSNSSVQSAHNGLTLFLKVVFPSLFPFFVASEILSKTGFIKSIGILLEPIMRPLFNVPGSGSFALAMGLTSGYPVGARITVSMREKKLLSKYEAERLLAFTNNSGPLFIVGAVAVGMFKAPGLGLLLLSCHILASLTVGVLFRFYGKERGSRKTEYKRDLLMKFKNSITSNVEVAINPGEMIGDAIKNSIGIMITIGGFIILFSVIINILNNIGIFLSISKVISFILGIDKDLINALLSGFFEITTGTYLASNANVPLLYKLMSVSMIMGWAGICIHSQVYSIISKTDISIKPYLFGKFLQGILSAIYIFIAIKLLDIVPSGSQPVFRIIDSSYQLNWHQYFFISCYNVMISIFLIVFMAFMSLFVILIFRNKQL
ncbi:UNVERIFIED_CONTAM: sporulation integral membrane protein YlbJ [Acetivibrio alkalicellulosi]